MLIDDDTVFEATPILMVLGMLNGEPKTKRIRTGVYEIGHFGASNFLREYKHFPEDMAVGPYGVCDSVEQLLEKCPELEKSDRKFLITLTRIHRDSQPAEGGWRWHKWGEYIGAQKPSCEYIHDEPEIKQVFCFHIYER